MLSRVYTLSSILELNINQTDLNKALSSPKPSARASTASRDAPPKSRRANIARYRSKRGNFRLSISDRIEGIEVDDDDGAGSIVGKFGLRLLAYIHKSFPWSPIGQEDSNDPITTPSYLSFSMGSRLLI